MSTRGMAPWLREALDQVRHVQFHPGAGPAPADSDPEGLMAMQAGRWGLRVRPQSPAGLQEDLRGATTQPGQTVVRAMGLS